jgi:hypothetical protein
VFYKEELLGCGLWHKFEIVAMGSVCKKKITVRHSPSKKNIKDIFMSNEQKLAIVRYDYDQDDQKILTKSEGASGLGCRPKTPSAAWV